MLPTLAPTPLILLLIPLTLKSPTPLTLIPFVLILELIPFKLKSPTEDILLPLTPTLPIDKLELIN